MSTTKGTGGDIIILEEAAYIDPNFAYETVFPLLIVGTTSLLAISTVTSEINFFTRLLRMRDKTTNLPLFSTLSVTLACAACREDGKAAGCPHMLHLVPRWQSGDRHIKLKTVMQDRPDLIESELSGLAFDSLQQVFRSVDLDIMFTQLPPAPITNEPIHLFIDPAAGGPGSDYAILSVTRQKGMITVSGVVFAECLPTVEEGLRILLPVIVFVYSLRRVEEPSGSTKSLYIAGRVWHFYKADGIRHCLLTRLPAHCHRGHDTTEHFGFRCHDLNYLNNQDTR